ncbi:MAG: hypothetical protein IKV16_02155 [Clostridia bacterium]|nr:hypothetical protein [Clostridia bacterium]
MDNNQNKDFLSVSAQIEKKIGYTFKDKGLLMQAFTRTSYCNEHRPSDKERYQSNEVLEFFGDSVLSTAIVTTIIGELSKRYAYGVKTDLNEGDFSNIRSKLSDKKNLSQRIKALGLSAYLRTGEGDRKLGVENEPSVMEDLFESIIGAIYIDSGFDMPRVIKVVSGMLSIKQYLTADNVPKQSSKNALQEWCADKKRRLPPPVYETVSESGPEHKRIYDRSCSIGGRVYAVGVGKNQKLADADAAEKTLKMLKREGDGRECLVDEKSPERLMEYLKSVRMSGLSFFDLGEGEDSTPERPSFKVSCRVGELSAEGVGVSKKNARCDSAKKMLDLLKKKDEKKAPQASKAARKSKPKSKPKNKT